MWGFPYFTLQQLKDGYPSKAKGRGWKAEMKYRNECKDIIVACGTALEVKSYTIHKGVVLLHRCLTRLASTEFEKLDKWALATACVFLATKMDSTYHHLKDITHASYRALRDKQGRPYEAEYYNEDGSPGNPAFLGRLSNKIRDAEMALVFAINFDFNVEVPVSMAVWQLNELALTEAAAERDPRLSKVRQYTVQLCAKSIATPSTVLCLMFPARHIALAAISIACKPHGYPLDLQQVDGKGYVPVMNTEDLEVVESELLKLVGGSGSRGATPAPAVAAGAAGQSSNHPSTTAGPPPAAAATAPLSHTRVGSAPGAAAAAAGTGNSNAAGSLTQTRIHSKAGTSVATTAVRRSQEAGISSAEVDAGLADEWFQLGSGAPAAAVDQQLGFQIGIIEAVKPSLSNEVAAGDGSAVEANTVGPRFNEPSPNSSGSPTGPQAVATAVGQQQQQQGQVQRKRLREDSALEALSAVVQEKKVKVAA